MRRIKLLLCALGALSTLYTFAEDNYLYVNPIEVTKGETEATLNLYLANTVTMCAFETYLTLPDGFSVSYEYDEDEEEDVWGIAKGGRLRTEHNYKCTKNGNTYHLLCFDGASNKNFYNTDPKKSLPLLVITLTIDSSANGGAFDVILGNTLLNHNENSTITEYKPADRYSDLIVKPAAGTQVTDVKDSVAVVATGSGEAITKNELKDFIDEQLKTTDLVGIDLRAATLGIDITSASDLRTDNVENNTLIILPSGSSITGDNIIVDKQCSNLVLDDESDFEAMIPFDAANAEYKAAISASLGYKTLVLPFTVSVPSGFTAYEVTSITGNTLNLDKVTVITADRPVLLAGTGTADLTATTVSVEADASLDGYKLTGTYKSINAPVGSYVLQNQSDQVAFYHVVDVQPVVGPFRAYLNAAGASLSALRISDGNTTQVIEIDSESGSLAEGSVMYFNLDGTLLPAPQKGMTIVKYPDGTTKKMYNR